MQSSGRSVYMSSSTRVIDSSHGPSIGSLEGHNERQALTAAFAESQRRLLAHWIQAFGQRNVARRAEFTRSADGRLKRAHSRRLVLMRESQSHAEVLASEREIRGLPPDRSLEPDWLELPEPALKAPDCPNNSDHGTVELAIRHDSDRFQFRDFRPHYDRPSLNTSDQLASRGETGSSRKTLLRRTATLQQPDKLQPPAPNADLTNASELHSGSVFGGFGHAMTWKSRQL